MSWHFSRALVEAFSEATCSDGEPSARSSGTPTPQAYCSPDRMTAFSRLSRFGMTFEPLTDDRGLALLTWYRAGFPVRTSASQERAQASTASGPGCGRTWHASLARFDRATSSWRTLQQSLLGDSDECSVTWPRSGMTADGLCWELPMLGRRTSEIGCGLWVGTPTATMTVRSEEFRKDRAPTPAEFVRMWPTPTVKGNYNKAGLSAKSGDGLATAVARWRTPNTVDAKGGTRRPGTDSQVQLCHQVGGALNPTWVEWLMGWPLGWTALKPLETDKFRLWQQQHGIS